MEKIILYLKSNPDYVLALIITFVVLTLACILGYFIKKYNLLAFLDKWFKKGEGSSTQPTQEEKKKNKKKQDDLPDFGFEFDSPEDLVAQERERELANATSASNAGQEQTENGEDNELSNGEQSPEDIQPKKSKFSQMIHNSLQNDFSEDYEQNKKYTPPVVPAKPAEVVIPENTDKVEEQFEGKWRIMMVGSTYVAELHSEDDVLLLKSQNYSELGDAKNAIEILKKHITSNNFTIVANKNGKYFFKLFSSANRLVCNGEPCDTRNDCLARIDEVKRIAFKAEIVRG